MNWFLIALLPPILWSLTNHIDKYLLTKYFKGGAIGGISIFFACIALLLLPIIILLKPTVLQSFDFKYLLISLNGVLYMLATLPYYYALEKDDTSLTVPLFQMIPVFSFIIGYLFFKETLNNTQIIGGLIILIASIFISLNISDLRKMKFKWDVFGLMALSCILYVLNLIIFKYFALQGDFLTTNFWEYTGCVIFGIFLFLFIKSYRTGFLNVLKQNKLKVLGINGLNRVIGIIGKIAYNYATILTSVTMVGIINGLQPVFVFIYGIILTIFFPKITQEDISKKTLIQRIIAIVVITIGVYLVNRI